MLPKQTLHNSKDNRHMVVLRFTLGSCGLHLACDAPVEATRSPQKQPQPPSQQQREGTVVVAAQLPVCGDYACLERRADCWSLVRTRATAIT